MITLLILLGIYTLSTKVIAPKAKKLLRRFSEKHTNFVNTLLNKKQITPEELQRLKNGFTFLVCLAFSSLLWLFIKIQEHKKDQETIQTIKKTIDIEAPVKKDTIYIESVNFDKPKTTKLKTKTIDSVKIDSIPTIIDSIKTDSTQINIDSNSLSKSQLNIILKDQKTR